MPVKKLSDPQIQELVLRSQNGDTEAFGKIYDHYFESVYRFTALRVPQEIAEDLVAEIFVKAWEKLMSYTSRKDVPFGAWLFRIAKNKVIDAYRTTRQWDEISEEMPDEDELNRADAKTRRSYLLVEVRRAMAKLPKRYQEILSLAYMADLPHGEIARVLRTTEGSVRILKFRALKKLEQILPPDLSENL